MTVILMQRVQRRGGMVCRQRKDFQKVTKQAGDTTETFCLFSEVEHFKASALVSALVHGATQPVQTHLQRLAKAGIKERE